MRVFLDVCCLNRPFDDQRQARVNLEATAVLHVLQQVRDGRHRLISSESLALESSRNVDEERRERVMGLLRLAAVEIRIGEDQARRANELAALEFGASCTAPGVRRGRFGGGVPHNR